jgi:uncharacterized protein
MTVLTISKSTQRRFLLGKQGLYPGRRWRGKAGVEAALRAGVGAQVDPLNVVAHSQDIVLYGRVLDYRPALLQTLLYEDRTCFETGGAVNIHPIEDLPYYQVVMARKREEPRRVQFATEHADLVEMVYQAIRERGPLSARDFAHAEKVRAGRTKGSFRSDNAVNQALYDLWIAGELMMHSRKGQERVYDLRERLVPAQFNATATAEEAEAFFALQLLHHSGLLAAHEWRRFFAGTMLRSVEMAEASARLEALVGAGTIAAVRLEAAAKTPCYLLADDLPVLEQVHAGHLPEAWQPLETSTDEEMTFLAPLEDVSARGRALPLFDFEYLWEVYKPPEQRRWGYYTLPILYQDRLVARTDLKLERATKTLAVKGFWLEHHAVLTGQFMTALARAFQRFMRFIEADTLDGTGLSPTDLREGVEKLLNVPE